MFLPETTNILDQLKNMIFKEKKNEEEEEERGFTGTEIIQLRVDGLGLVSSQYGRLCVTCTAFKYFFFSIGHCTPTKNACK